MNFDDMTSPTTQGKNSNYRFAEPEREKETWTPKKMVAYLVVHTNSQIACAPCFTKYCWTVDYFKVFV